MMLMFTEIEGGDGFGLAHITEKHPEISGKKLQELVKDGDNQTKQ